MVRAVLSWIAIVIFTLPGAARNADRLLLRLRITLEFDGPAPPEALTKALRSETAARWKHDGVLIAWNRVNACHPADALVDVVVQRDKASSSATEAGLTLGVTHIDDDNTIGGPITIFEPAIRASLAARSPEYRNEAARFPGGADAELGRAMGRVLAHELGHILLATPYHRPTGLMRARFPADELAGLNPGPFGLGALDVARLHNRLPVILAAQTARMSNC
jgi:hypothetical protein